jgi:NADPH-dependent 2,4-dienoyl-CoA reductase/sulfur reductase-like enzyme
VVVLERDERAGGILPQCVHTGFGLRRYGRDLAGPEYAGLELARALKSGAEVRLDCCALRLEPGGGVRRPNAVVAVSPAGLEEIRAPSVVLAMGCRERPAGSLGIPGSRVAGVMTAGTAQRLINIAGIMPGRKAVVLGSGDVGLIVARRLALEGATVAGVFEAVAWAGGLPRNVSQCLCDFGIPLFLGHTVAEVHGRARLEGVTVCEVGRDMRPVRSTAREIACDTLLLSVGLIPENELSREAGVPISPATGGPLVDECGASLTPGVYACGNAVYVHDFVDDVTTEGEIAGAAAARFALGESGDRRRDGCKMFFREGRNVRFVSPAFVRLGRGRAWPSLALRSRRPAANVTPVFRWEGGQCSGPDLEFVNPGETIRLNLPVEVRGLIESDTRRDVTVEVSLESQ